METYVMEEKEKELDIKQLFFYLIDNVKWIILIGLVFGLLLGGYGYYKAEKRNAGYSSNISIRDLISQNRTKWYSLDTSVAADAFNNPPAGACMANAKVYVDFDYSSIEGNNNLDFSDMNIRLQGDIIALAASNEVKQAVIDKLDLHSYDDMKDLSLDDLRFMATMGFAGANIMQVTVIDVDPQRVVDICDTFSDVLVERLSEYEGVDNIRLYEEAKLTYTSATFASNSNSYLKSTIKFGCVGSVGGMILMCGILFLIFLFVDVVRTSSDLAYIGVDTFGFIPDSKKKRDREYTRLAYNISFLDMDKVFLIPVDETVLMEDINEKVVGEASKECHCTVAESIIDDPKVILELKKADSVILFAKYGKTLLKDVEFVKKELERAKVKFLGVVITNAKHV